MLQVKVLTLPYPTSPHLTLPYLTLPYLTLPYPTSLCVLQVPSALAGATAIGAARGGQIALAPASSKPVTSQLLPRLLADASRRGAESLFVATWSFTEASMAARRPLSPLLARFDRIFMPYRDTWDRLDQTRYLMAWVRRELLPTHSVCVWEHRIVAVRRTLGERARCLRALKCQQCAGWAMLKGGGVRPGKSNNRAQSNRTLEQGKANTGYVGSSAEKSLRVRPGGLGDPDWIRW